jgi:hypothetical protein
MQPGDTSLTKGMNMEPWAFVVVAAAITVVPAMALTLLCRTEAQKGDERLLPRWAKARDMVTVALGGGAAIAAIPEPGARSESASGVRHPRPNAKRQAKVA